MTLHYFENLMCSSFPEIMTTALSLDEMDASEGSTMAVDQIKIVPADSASTGFRSPRKVCFGLDSNSCEIFYQSHILSREERRQLWYSTEEMLTFRQEMRKDTDAIYASTDEEQHEWFIAILDAYTGLKDVTSREDIDQVFRVCQVAIQNPHLVGLDKYVFRPIWEQDRKSQRNDMFRNICESDTRLVRFHRKTSRTASRTDRLLAHFVAVMQIAGTDDV